MPHSRLLFSFIMTWKRSPHHNPSLLSRAKLNGPKKVRFPSYVSPAIQRYSTPPVPVSVAVGVSVGVMRRDGSAARLPFRRFSRQSTGQKRQRGFSQKGQKSEVLRWRTSCGHLRASRTNMTRIGALSSPAAVNGSAHNRMRPYRISPSSNSSWMVDKET